MSAKKHKVRYDRWLLLILVILPIVLWHLASPVVSVDFSADSKEVFRYVWNTQDRIHRGDIKHGGAAIESGYIFPGEDFFMMFFWWTDKGFQQCIDITPRHWATIDVYLDATGRVDTTKTAPDVISRLKKCPGEPDPFRP